MQRFYFLTLRTHLTHRSASGIIVPPMKPIAYLTALSVSALPDRLPANPNLQACDCPGRPGGCARGSGRLHAESGTRLPLPPRSPRRLSPAKSSSTTTTPALSPPATGPRPPAAMITRTASSGPPPPPAPTPPTRPPGRPTSRPPAPMTCMNGMAMIRVQTTPPMKPSPSSPTKAPRPSWWTFANNMRQMEPVGHLQICGGQGAAASRPPAPRRTATCSRTR